MRLVPTDNYGGMMHTTILNEAPEGDLVMIHNADYSGDVTIKRIYNGREAKQWVVPGYVVQYIRELAVSEVLDWLSEFPICDVEVG